jgi:DNA-binding NarL/FixJ family response regulator
LSQETATDFVHQAVSLDAWGYVFKMHAEVDLLQAIDAVLSGQRFISSV